MHFTLLRLLFPHLQRILAGKVAEYLHQRREKRLHGEEETVDCPPCPPCPQEETADEITSPFPVWYMLSGLLLGGAISSVFYFITRRVQGEA